MTITEIKEQCHALLAGYEKSKTDIFEKRAIRAFLVSISLCEINCDHGPLESRLEAKRDLETIRVSFDAP